MKILICNLGIGGGGAERVLIDFLSYWLRESQMGGGDINKTPIHLKIPAGILLNWGILEARK